MTAVMNEGTAPCGGPGGASIAKGSRRKQAIQERTQECVTAVMTEGPEGRSSTADSRTHD